ncbi:unnamed protein product [Ectocarpus sp. CCAP 1310/34]|nr:unnamed protein product [Ectocarpus sp. CCAP 1310/34]
MGSSKKYKLLGIPSTMSDRSGHSVEALRAAAVLGPNM